MSRNPSFRIALAILAAIALSLAFVACAADDDAPAPAPTPAPAPAPAPEPEPDDHDHEHAVYRVSLYEPKISSNTTLQAIADAIPFPEGVDSAPPVAFFSHPMGESPWELGGMASAGLKTLAETGDSSEFNAEAEAAGYTLYYTESDAVQAWIQMALTGGEATIEVEHEQPCFTYAQMIAPSPDWFIGFSSVCLVDENEEWITNVELEAVAYDAGTAAGMEYALKAEGADTMEPITLLDMAPFSPAGTPVSIIHVEEVHEE